MAKVILALLLVMVAGLYAYKHFQPAPMSPRDVIRESVAEAKKQHSNISPEQEKLLAIQLAVLNYTAMNGHPPDSLDALVPTYFDSVPKNPATGEAFPYTRDGKKYHLGAPRLVIASSDRKSGEAQQGTPASGLLTPEVGQDFVNPNLMEQDKFRYDPTGRRDPFRPFDASARPLRAGHVSPLEQYALGQLRLTAVLLDTVRGSTGVVEDETGKGYNVRLGTKIGSEGGVIVGIEKNKMKILLTETDITGKETQKIEEMKIQALPGDREAEAKPMKMKIMRDLRKR